MKLLTICFPPGRLSNIKRNTNCLEAQNAGGYPMGYKKKHVVVNLNSGLLDGFSLVSAGGQSGPWTRDIESGRRANHSAILLPDRR